VSGILITFRQVFALTPQELQEAFSLKDSGVSIAMLAGSYAVMLINTSGICITRGRRRPVGSANWSPWFATQRICRNCDHSYEECFKNHNWTPVLTTSNNDPSFELMLIDDPDPQGNAHGGQWTISPNAHAGGVIGLG
jgi:hypothetical protein